MYGAVFPAPCGLWVRVVLWLWLADAVVLIWYNIGFWVVGLIVVLGFIAVGFKVALIGVLVCWFVSGFGDCWLVLWFA